jgi:hypothetical protein
MCSEPSTLCESSWTTREPQVSTHRIDVKRTQFSECSTWNIAVPERRQSAERTQLACECVTSSPAPSPREFADRRQFLPRGAGGFVAQLMLGPSPNLSPEYRGEAFGRAASTLFRKLIRKKKKTAGAQGQGADRPTVIATRAGNEETCSSPPCSGERWGEGPFGKDVAGERKPLPSRFRFILLPSSFPFLAAAHPTPPLNHGEGVLGRAAPALFRKLMPLALPCSI